MQRLSVQLEDSGVAHTHTTQKKDAHPHRHLNLIAQPVSLRISAARKLLVSCRL